MSEPMNTGTARLADLLAMRAAHRDSYPMGNIHHGTPARPDWGTFCVGCRESWPCEVTVLLDHIDALADLLAARVLREAREEIAALTVWRPGSGPYPSVHDALAILRDRADRIEAGA